MNGQAQIELATENIGQNNDNNNKSSKRVKERTQ